MSSSPIYTGLEYVALAMIFLPEPATTFIGVGLLGYVRSKKDGEQSEVVYRRRSSFGEIYSYSLKMKDGSLITYQVAGIRKGQMPREWPVTYKLNTADSIRDSRLSTKNNIIYALPLRNNDAVRALPQRKQFAGLQEGLLANRMAGAGYAKSVVARRAPRPKWAV